MFYCKNENEMIALGKKLGFLLKKNDVLLLTGDLGAGKTTFTKGIALGLSIDQMIKSPTFTIVREYEGRLPLYHLDVYRIGNDVDSINLDSFLYGDGVTVIEWGELIEEDMPKDYLKCSIVLEDDCRCVQFLAHGERAKQIISGMLDD